MLDRDGLADLSALLSIPVSLAGCAGPQTIFSAPIPTYVSALTPRSPRRTLIRAAFERGGAGAINPVWTHPIIGGAAGAICDAARDDAAVPS